MTHDPEANITMPVGMGFVLVSEKPTTLEIARRSDALDELGWLDGELLWPGIEDDVKDLERMLK